MENIPVNVQRFREVFLSIINYIPGLVILIFGMFALYSTVLLIETREVLSQRYHTYVMDVLDFQNAFYDFELSYDAFQAGSPDASIETVKNDFKALNEHFADLQKDFYNYSSSSNGRINHNYEDYIYLMQQDMNDILTNLMLYEQSLGSDDEAYHRHELHEHIEKMFTSVKQLQNEVFSNFELAVFSKDLDNQELWLYWSVIFMGFSGFILVVLNSDKIRSMKKLNAERVNTLTVLQERLEALETAHDGILIINSKGKISYLNKAVCQFLGIAPDEREGFYGIGWPRLFLEEDAKFIEQEVYSVFDGGDDHWIGDFRVHQRQGGRLDTELSVSRLVDGGYIGTFQDISEKRQSEKEKRELENQFYQAQKMEAIGRLAGGIAHDFNNILAAMNGYAEFLLDDLDENTDQYNFARNILQAGLQARDLVDQMLAFSRRGTSEQDVIDISSSVREVISMLQATIPKTIELYDEIENHQALIHGNLTQISQVAMNLCVNAIDAMERDHGKLTIVVKEDDVSKFSDVNGVISQDYADAKDTAFQRIDDLTHETTRLITGQFVEGQRYVCLTVEDTGSGMSRVILERVFEPFFTTKAVDKGTGLGLATVHGVVLSHRGVLVIESTLGQGTRFDLYFPLVNTKEAVQGIKQVAERTSSNSKKKRHILIVEDQENVRLLTVRMLQRLGYEVSTARSGLEGLDIVRENPNAFDLVVTDYNMPKMTGLEMVLQVHIDMPDIPFIILSGYSEDKIMELIDSHPAVKAVLRKPIVREELGKQIEAVLDGKSGQVNDDKEVV